MKSRYRDISELESIPSSDDVERWNKERNELYRRLQNAKTKSEQRELQKQWNEVKDAVYF